MVESITAEEAHELIDESDGGFIVTTEVDSVPALGEIDIAELRVSIETEVYRYE